ncbi:MAG: TGS domain-containing protein [Firmicutes bacterium]|nr:TGS domain-containing protein [Bacillota bacterium]
MPANTNLDEVTMQPITVLRELINSLRIPQYAIWLVKVNGEEVTLDQNLADGDTVEIFAAGDGA